MLSEDKKLDAQIQKVNELKRQAELLTKQIRKTAIREIRQYMARYRIMIEDLKGDAAEEKAAAAAPGAKKAKRAAIAPKYRSDDGKQFWTGRGITPKWLAKELEAGRKKEEFLIEKPKSA